MNRVGCVNVSELPMHEIISRWPLFCIRRTVKKFQTFHEQWKDWQENFMTVICTNFCKAVSWLALECRNVKTTCLNKKKKTKTYLRLPMKTTWQDRIRTEANILLFVLKLDKTYSDWDKVMPRSKYQMLFWVSVIRRLRRVQFLPLTYAVAQFHTPSNSAIRKTNTSEIRQLILPKKSLFYAKSSCKSEQDSTSGSSLFQLSENSCCNLCVHACRDHFVSRGRQGILSGRKMGGALRSRSPVHTGHRTSRNRRMQIMEHTANETAIFLSLSFL